MCSGNTKGRKKRMKQKKQSVLGGVLTLVISVLIGVFLISSEGDYMFGEAKDFYEMLEDEGEPVKGEYVTLNVDAVVDWYAETQHKINGIIPAGSEQHCLVWLDNDAFISLTVKGKENIAKIDDLIDDTYAFLSYETDYLPSGVTFEGRLTNVGSEVSQYYNDVLRLWEIDTTEGMEIYYLTIDTTQTKGVLFIVLALVVVFALAGVVMIVTAVKSKKEAKAFASQAPSTGVVNDPFGNMGNVYNQNSTSTYSDDNNNLYS